MWTTATPFLVLVQTLCSFFSVQEALRVMLVSRELFATKRKAVSVTALRNAHKFQLAQYRSVTGICNICVWDVSMLQPAKAQPNPTLDLHRIAFHKGSPSTLSSTCTHSFFGADLRKLVCLLLCGYFLPIMKTAESGRELLFLFTVSSFLPSRRCWYCLSS